MFALTHFINFPPPHIHAKIVVQKDWDSDAAEVGMDRAVDINTGQGRSVRYGRIFCLDPW